MRRALLNSAITLTFLAASLAARPCRAEELYPKHLDARTQASIKRGLDWLAKTQAPEGNWTASQDATTYPTSMVSLAGMAFLSGGNTPSRGTYADNVKHAELWLMGNARPSGVITDASEGNGRPMHGHGFSLLFLASVYGMETDPRTRDTLKVVITNAISLTARGQSPLGGWTYMPGGGDEGSVTVTQMQGLRAASNAGFLVPKSTIEGAVKYLEICKTPENGIKYSAASSPQPRLPISAAAVATLYNAGDYDSPLADACLKYVWEQFKQRQDVWTKGGGHDFYAHLYAAQAFYQAGDKYWDVYFPKVREQLLSMQQPDGSWNGEIGPVYATSIALIILQLPYKLVPIYQR
ncbi:MAG TPA: prenyltransferase/squalene oxidase repeat-containing protein [Humisphaera sp.]|nr:prenyltransferase/squalene oxidase repeat-containing protein [Humisphaera sp.]